MCIIKVTDPERALQQPKNARINYNKLGPSVDVYKFFLSKFLILEAV